ncbi:MAG: HlyC/CorC family transporter [Fibrobacteria bacterium]|nr:HlyC/CorC family transporter [Fibrobacteria bacterium]
MNALGLTFVFLGVLVLLNALFAASEMALATARRSRLAARAENGDRGAEAAIRLQEDPNRFLSTIQVGITVIGTLLAVYSGDRFEEPLKEFLEPYMGGWAGTGVVVVVVGLVSFVQLLFGELVPKRVAMQSADSMAAFLARPMIFVSVVTRPAVSFLSGATNLVLWIIRRHDVPEETVTQEDIRHMVRESAEDGEIQEHEEDLIHSVFAMGEKLVRQIRTPRTEIVGVDLDRPLSEQMPSLMESGYSRFPAFRGNLDHIEGVVLAKDLYRACMAESETPSVGDFLRPAVYIPENTRAIQLLQLMQKQRSHMAIVVNEHGIFEGVATLEDLLEQIVGAIEDETDEASDPDIVQTGGGCWLVSGTVPVERVREELAIEELPEEDEGHYDTLAGLVLSLMGRIPATGEEVESAGFVFRVVDMDGLRIDKIEVSRLSRRENHRES